MFELAVLLRPIAFHRPRRAVAPPSWLDYTPFAFWLVDALQPDRLVELGCHTGNSYASFAQAVQTLNLPTACYGVDTWAGDPHAGAIDPADVREWFEYHDRCFGTFSRLMQATFDRAASDFADGSIDLLHIDGYHTYEAVSHDFAIWRPKMSSRGVVLLHDIGVRRDDFGVWRLWEELSGRYPTSFEFAHSNGLGVVAVGSKVEPKLLEFLACARENPTGVRRVFEMLGERIGDERMLRQLGDFLNVTQGYLDNWKRRLGQAVHDAAVDAQHDPLAAAQRTARDLKELSKATTTAPAAGVTT